LHDSNDGQRSWFLLPNCDRVVDLSADRINAREKFLRGKLIDYDRSRTTAHILWSEISAPRNRHLKHIKISRRNYRHLADRLFAWRIRRRTGYVKGTIPFFVIKRRVAAYGSGANSG